MRQKYKICTYYMCGTWQKTDISYPGLVLKMFSYFQNKQSMVIHYLFLKNFTNSPIFARLHCYIIVTNHSITCPFFCRADNFTEFKMIL